MAGRYVITFSRSINESALASCAVVGVTGGWYSVVVFIVRVVDIVVNRLNRRR